jgi:methanethiol oxidase
MKRREFLAATAAGSVGLLARSPLTGQEHAAHRAAGRIYTSPSEAMASPREELAFVVGTYVGTKVQQPDFLASVDLDPASRTYGQIVHRLPMPNVGDELHHFGWNACGSCHGEQQRRYLIVPGLVSSRIHVIDTADPKQPKMHKVIEPPEVIEKTKLTAPHTVHFSATVGS